jgi:hypothetical protein
LEDLFFYYYGKEDHQEVVSFTKFLEPKQFLLAWQNLPASSTTLQPKAKVL